MKAADLHSPVDLANVRPRPRLLDALFGLSPSSGTTLYPYVYVGWRAYVDLHAPNPNPYLIGLIVHEQEHIKRIRAYGPGKWYLRYALQSRFRLEEELVAYGRQFAYLKGLGLIYDLDWCARRLSGPAYLWSTSRYHALVRLQSLWARADSVALQMSTECQANEGHVKGDDEAGNNSHEASYKA